jgi:hypothetical protein
MGITHATVATGTDAGTGEIHKAEWNAAHTGADFVLLEQHTASASASLDFTAFISATYDEYQFEFINVLPATNNVDLLARVGTGGGPTWDATSGNYAFTGAFSYINTGGGEGSSTGQTGAVISGGVRSINLGVCGHMRLFDPSGSAQYKVLLGQMVHDNASVGVVNRAV